MPSLTTVPYPFFDNDSVSLKQPLCITVPSYVQPFDDLNLTKPKNIAPTVIYPPADLLVGRNGDDGTDTFLDYYQQTSEDVFEKIDSWVDIAVPYAISGLTATFNRDYIFCTTRNLGEKIYWFKRVSGRQYVKMPQFQTGLADVLDCILTPDEQILITVANNATSGIYTRVYSFDKQNDAFTDITDNCDDFQIGRLVNTYITPDSKYFYLTFSTYSDCSTHSNMTQIILRDGLNFSLVLPCLTGEIDGVYKRGSYGSVLAGGKLVTDYVEGLKVWTGSPGSYDLVNIIDLADGVAHRLAVSPDGKHLAVPLTGGNNLIIYRVDTLLLDNPVEATVDVYPDATQDDAAYSRDGKYLAVGGADLVSATPPDCVSIYKRTNNTYTYIRPINNKNARAKRVLWI